MFFFVLIFYFSLIIVCGFNFAFIDTILCSYHVCLFFFVFVFCFCFLSFFKSYNYEIF